MSKTCAVCGSRLDKGILCPNCGSPRELPGKNPEIQRVATGNVVSAPGEIRIRIPELDYHSNLDPDLEDKNPDVTLIDAFLTMVGIEHDVYLEKTGLYCQIARITVPVAKLKPTTWIDWESHGVRFIHPDGWIAEVEFKKGRPTCQTTKPVMLPQSNVQITVGKGDGAITISAILAEGNSVDLAINNMPVRITINR